MRLIVGCGYLGKRVAKIWLDRGIQVAALTRTESGAEALRTIGVKPIIGDVTDPKSLDSLSGNGPFEGLFHAVGLDRSSGKSMEEVYVHGLENILRILPSTLCPKIVFISSTSVYSQMDGSWINEETPPDAKGGSGGVVQNAEILLRKERPESVILRFAGIYGPGRLLRGKAIESGEPIPVDPDKWLNLIHVEDGARAVDLAWDKAPVGSTFLVADGKPVLRGDYYRSLARLLKAPSPTFTEGTPGSRGGPDASHRRIDSRRAQQTLDWFPIFDDHEAGLRAILQEERG
jgi:nucleoside-diphosphate-sugar epimerase